MENDYLLCIIKKSYKVYFGGLGNYNLGISGAYYIFRSKDCESYEKAA